MLTVSAAMTPLVTEGNVMTKLTKSKIDGLEIKSKDYFIWDSDLPGFGIRVFSSGRKKFVLQYRHGRKSRRMMLGQHGAITLGQARKLAIQALAKIGQDIDPLQARKNSREALTVKELADRFDAEHIVVDLKETTAKEYRRKLKLFILPAIGRMRITDVTRADVAKFHHDYRHKPYQANRNIKIISKMFNLAELWGLGPDGTNPRRHIKKYPEKKRERYFSPAELQSIGHVLREMEAEGLEFQSAINAIRLLLFTGCRLNEIMKLEWEWVDLDNAALHLPDSKTGAKTVHLGQAAINILRNVEKLLGNPYVIIGKNPGQRLTDLQPFWQRVRARAGLKDARFHDLRHTFASIAVSNGKSLPMIGKLLGHSQVQTTAQYAHLATAPVVSAANDVTSLIAKRH
jgi:integrase